MRKKLIKRGLEGIKFKTPTTDWSQMPNTQNTGASNTFKLLTLDINKAKQVVLQVDANGNGAGLGGGNYKSGPGGSYKHVPGGSGDGPSLFQRLGGWNTISTGSSIIESLLPLVENSNGFNTANNVLGMAALVPVVGKYAGLAKLALNVVNSLGGTTLDSVNNDQTTLDTAANSGGGYGSIMSAWDEAKDLSGKKVGFFTNSRALNAKIHEANRQMLALSNIIGEKRLQDLLTGQMGDIWNQRTMNELNGGFGNISFGRLGLKVEILDKVHSILNRPKVVDTLKEWEEVPKFKSENEGMVNSFLKGGKTSKNDEKQIKERLFKEWPVLSNIEFHIVPDSNFTSKNTGIGSIEYFSPEEKEYMSYPNGFKYKNPYLGEASIVYNPNDNDYEDIKMDLLHALRVQDPKYKALVNEIDKAVLEGDDDLKSNAKLRYDEDLKKYGKEYMPFENYVLNEVDGLLRNLFYNGSSEILKSKRYYPNKENLKKWNKHLMPYIQKIESYLNGTQAFKQGGQMNVIPEGSLHARLHHMENAEGLTKKGIPVVSIAEGGQMELQAEIELNEIIFRLEVTQELEKLMEDGSDNAAIEAGKLLVKEIFENTDDRTGLLKSLEPEKKKQTPEDVVNNHQVF